MSSKDEPGKFDCYANALPDEPMFILLARDADAPNIVRYWAERRNRKIIDGDLPESDGAQVIEARECADKMEAWRARNLGRWRVAAAGAGRKAMKRWEEMDRDEMLAELKRLRGLFARALEQTAALRREIRRVADESVAKSMDLEDPWFDTVFRR